MNVAYLTIPGIIPLALMVFFLHGLRKRSSALSHSAEVAADQARAELQVSVVLRGLATWIEVANISATATARNLRITLDDIPATEHVERARSTCPPICDLPPGQAWIGEFIFARTHPESVIVRWDDSEERMLESPLRP